LRCLAWSIVAVLATWLGLFAPAAAHPLGNFTINHLAKLSLDRRGITIRYVVDMAEIPTFQVMAERRIEGSNTRTRGFVQWGNDETQLVAAGLVVEADGIRLRLHANRPKVSTRPGAGGLSTLYFVDTLRGEFLGAPPRMLLVLDKNYEQRIGWRDIVVGSQTEPTHELRAYPKTLLQSPRSVTAVQLRLAPDLTIVQHDALTAAVAAPAGSTSQVRSNLLSDMLAKGSSHPAIVLWTLIVAVGLGALHALEPGHGKTLLAVSLVGARATAQQALVLAIALTIAHTAGVLALGVALIVLAHFIVPESVYPWVTLASGVMVAVLGGSALARYVKERRGQAHEHGYPKVVLQGTSTISFRGAVLIAMSGNFAPCPAALVVLLTALALHRGGYGLLVVVAFSIGLAGVLTTLGILVVRGASWLSHRRGFERITACSPLATAFIIAAIGVVMVTRAAASIALVPFWGVAALVIIAIAGYALAPGHSHAAAPCETAHGVADVALRRPAL